LKSVSSSWIKERIFRDSDGVCLIHGDTLSTILGLYLAKRAGLKVAHVEAGLRSFCWSEPFPEEILRVIAMRFSDILFAPSKWAFDNLVRMGLKEKSILLPYNTGQEAVVFSLSKNLDLGLDLDNFSLVTIHRMENIFSKKRLDLIVDLVMQISCLLPIVFIQHPPTINQLKRFGYQKSLGKIENIHFFKILSHTQFIHLLNRCEFVITDGGSIQEEAFYLGKPCLLLRRYTERNEGLGENVVLSGLNKDRIDYFLKHFLEFKRQSKVGGETLASDLILDTLKRYT
jgi:UDP-N-acetylglucosamine 2-epimerase